MKSTRMMLSFLHLIATCTNRKSKGRKNENSLPRAISVKVVLQTNKIVKIVFIASKKIKQ